MKAFERGNKEEAEQLLPRLKDPAIVRTRTWRDFDVVYATRQVSLLHLAADHGWENVVKVLVTKYNCDINCKDSFGLIPLHYAASSGHLDVVKYLERLCDPMTTDYEGCTPLHYACANAHVDVAKYLISEAHCNPSCVNGIGDTPLHLACKFHCDSRIAKYLISTGQVDPLTKNDRGYSPVDLLRCDKYVDLLELFRPFQQYRRDFPVHTYTKLILIGCSAVGKTTLSQLIILASKANTILSTFLSPGHVPKVECLTAGIIPLHVESKVKEVGNMVIYDFAGQQEYYSSHMAVLEHIMRSSAATFLCVIDLSRRIEVISESIHYWISFIENAVSCCTAKESSHVIIVGSHADLLTLQELKERSSLLESIAESRVKQVTYKGFVSMDCRQAKGRDARHFLTLLFTSQQSIQEASLPRIPLHCHMLYAFLRTKLEKTGCTLQELYFSMASEDIILSLSELKAALTKLNDMGLVLFLQNQQHASSWVVVEKDILLREVIGTLFAPDDFKQYHQISSNTGIVPITTFQKLFPQHSSEMLVGCLQNMEFCHTVDPSALQSTQEIPCAPQKVNHLFFPGLVKEHRPSNPSSSMRFGWCLGCRNPHQFFSNRFLHILLLRIAFTFPLASDHLPPSSTLHGLERRCQVWRNGISWKSVSGVSTIVEIIDRNRWVIVLLSKQTRETAEICSSVIRMILDIQKELCKGIDVSECLISLSLLEQYPFDVLPDTDLFSIRDVARSMLSHHQLILDRKEGSNELLTKDALSFEPYFLMKTSSVLQLFDSSNADQPVPAPLFQEALMCCNHQHLQQKPKDYKDLREYVDKQSIFAGRNPLVSHFVILHVF